MTRNIRNLFSLILVLTLQVSAQIEHGSLELNDVGGVVDFPSGLSLGPGTSAGVSLDDRSNRGDYWLIIDPPGEQNDGILISSVAEHRNFNSDYAIASGYSSSDPLLHFISSHIAPTTGEGDIQTAFAFFPKNQFLVGLATNSVNDEDLDALTHSSTGISFSTALGQNPGAEFVYTGDEVGVATLDLTGLDNSTSQKGILLVNGAKNESNFALSEAMENGTFKIYLHDLTTNADTYESDPVSFVYIPRDHDSEQIVALGRIAGNGASLMSAGEFYITSEDNGTWLLRIPRQTNDTGTLIISPEGGRDLNWDNILSYEWDLTKGGWVIESRDLPGLGLQNVGSQPAFSFAFIAFPPTILRVDASVLTPGDGSTWENAFKYLQDALTAAEENTQIWVAGGTYYPHEGVGSDDGQNSTFKLLKNVALYGGFAGSENLLSERDARDISTILSGDLGKDDTNGGDTSENAYTIVTAETLPFRSATIDGFTITSGNNGDPDQPPRGSGMWCETAEVEITLCRFINHNSNGLVGALSVTGSSSPFLSDCEFADNSALIGAAIYAESGPTMSLRFCTFRRGTAEERGGAIRSSRPLVLNSCRFSNNTAELGNGGAIFHNGSGLMEMTNCNFTANSAAGDGGAIYSSSQLISSRCSFESNTAPSTRARGGGIFASSLALITNSKFAGNQADHGGGLYLTTPNQEQVITNCAFLGNTATSDGAGMSIFESSPDLINCTFNGNRASGNGGGLLSRNSTPRFLNCIIWGNQDQSGTATFASSLFNQGISSPTYSYSLIENSFPTGQSNLDGNLEANDPLFIRSIDPATAPNLEGDHTLQRRSSSLDAGDGIFGLSGNGTSRDLAGRTRFLTASMSSNGEKTIDLGAYEGSTSATFALLYPQLEKLGDENGNGLTNYLDYAHGFDPIAPHNSRDATKIIGKTVTFSHRINGADAFVSFEKSSTLLPGSWSRLINGTDYTLSNREDLGARFILEIELTTAEPTQFVRQVFAEIEEK